MKYSLIFAATAAAYDAYGAKPPPPPPNCLTTVYPGYGKDPVYVTKQNQPYPTCVSKAYGGNSCDKWGEDYYVHTTIPGYNGKPVTVTKYDQPVTVYYQKKTLTHTATAGYGAYATPAGNYPQPTAGPEYKINQDGCWYELYEKIEYAPYNKLGAHAYKGYSGSGLYPDADKYQYVQGKVYKNGKWSQYTATHTYGTPTAYATTYATPGTYTVPAQTVTCDSTVYYAAETTRYAKAGETCTYGGMYVSADKTGYLTAGYAGYDTVNGHQENVLKYSTIYVTKTGAIELCKPTTTVYAQDTSYVLPTASYYTPGVYHYAAQTVTVTATNYAYTCPYEAFGKPTGAYAYSPASPTGVYPAGYKPAKPAQPYYPASSNYTTPYEAPCPEEEEAAKGYPPAKPVDSASGYPPQPVTPGQGYPPSAPSQAYPPSTPSQAYPPSTPSQGYPPAQPYETPCPEEEEAAKGYPAKPVDSASGYPPKPVDSSSSYPPQPVTPGQVYPPSKPVDSSSTYPSNPPVAPYPAKPVTPANSYPPQPAETPCEEEEKPGYKATGYSS